MCIILTLDAGTRPAESEFRTLLETCWANNPDGAGFMFALNGKVHGHKGFMEFTDLWDALMGAPESCPLVIHFRIATSGGVNPECTHPYPVSNNIRQLHALRWTSSAGIAHNGVIYGMFTDSKRGISDTVFYTKTIVSTVKATCTGRKTIATSKRAARMLDETCDGSRLAVLDKDGNLARIGRWEKVAPGIYASNGTYKGARAKKAAKSQPAMLWDDYGLPVSCAGCVSHQWCETECPMCYDVAVENGYTALEYNTFYEMDATPGVSNYEAF